MCQTQRFADRTGPVVATRTHNDGQAKTSWWALVPSSASLHGNLKPGGLLAQGLLAASVHGTLQTGGPLR